MHEQRTWCVRDVTDLTPEHLAEQFTQHSWVTCAAWKRGAVAYLIDSTGEDGAFELAVVEVDEAGEREILGHQFESVTFGWTTLARATQYIRSYDDPAERARLLGQYAHPVVAHLHPADETCPACA